MLVFEKNGVFSPSQLAAELRTAGIDIIGVTCSEDEDGMVTAVQVICGDGANRKDVQKACAAHVPGTGDLAAARTAKADQIRRALAASDVWVIRDYEDKVSLTTDRKAYRATLRALLDAVQTHESPGAVEIPDPPALR